MVYIETCRLKLNATLRVLGRRGDGYHDVLTAYWKFPSPDVLKIEPCAAEGDLVSVSGLCVPGDPRDNILYSACAMLHKRCPAMPSLKIDLYKHIPPGSGVGAGSGNAAALIRWFERSPYSCGERIDSVSAAALGADVAFLCGDSDLVLAGGIGENFSPIGDAPGLAAVILFPNWSSNTASAYASIDRMRGSAPPPVTPSEAADEAASILNDLRSGKRVGLLPNDFIGCMQSKESCYNNIYGALDDCGAVAWGLCGSGSSCFGLFEKAEARERSIALGARLASSGFDWIEQTLFLE